MSVTEIHKIDDVIVDEENRTITLCIFDNMGWNEKVEYNHLMILQKKVNTYLAYAENGQMLEAFPQAVGMRVCFEIIFKYVPSGNGVEFIRVVNEILSNSSIELNYKVDETLER